LSLSIAALVVALLGATPLGHAAGRVVQKIPPFAKRANYANVAGNANALGGHKPSAFALLGSDGKLASSLLPAGSQGAQGPQGPAGPKGETGPRGPAGLVSAYASTPPTSGVYTIMNGSKTVASLALPAGRYLIVGRVLISDTSRLTGGSKTAQQFSAVCSLAAGTSLDYNQIRSATGQVAASIIPSTTMLLHRFEANGTVTLRCTDSQGFPAAWANARISAVQVSTGLTAGGNVAPVAPVTPIVAPSP
jgi:hypothetical protein